MDGNATWASQRSETPMSGYSAGIKAASDVVVAAKIRGIRYLTFYAFSSENWGRPKIWISDFMDLMARFFDNSDALRKMLDVGARIKVIGDRSRLSQKFQRIIDERETSSISNNEIFAQIAISYGGRDDIVRAVKKMAEAGADFTEDNISANLDTAGIPDPQLIVRTGNNRRLSNFLLWQSSYSEFYFSNALWPDFDDVELDRAIHEFSRRKRTYGR
jgi:undecaprenyl diphosphate synthase